MQLPQRLSFQFSHSTRSAAAPALRHTFLFVPSVPVPLPYRIVFLFVLSAVPALFSHFPALPAVLLLFPLFPAVPFAAASLFPVPASFSAAVPDTLFLPGSVLLTSHRSRLLFPPAHFSFSFLLLPEAAVSVRFPSALFPPALSVCLLSFQAAGFSFLSRHGSHAALLSA